jgi:hypothetical protein
MAMLLPLMLTLLGAAGTGLGGLLVVIQPHMNFKRLGALQVSAVIFLQGSSTKHPVRTAWSVP